MSQAVFDDIYRRNAWNGVESLSGPGSGSSATKHLSTALVQLVEDLRIKSVLDAPCGDGFWMPDLPGYVGIDVSSEAIALATQRHPERVYFQNDIRGAKFYVPVIGFDLVICRDLMQHLSLADGLQVLNEIRGLRARWMLISTYVGTENVEITPETTKIGMGYTPNLLRPPFSMPAPERYIPDGFGWEDPDVVRDERKMLGLWPGR